MSSRRGPSTQCLARSAPALGIGAKADWLASTLQFVCALGWGGGMSLLTQCSSQSAPVHGKCKGQCICAPGGHMSSRSGSFTQCLAQSAPIHGIAAKAGMLCTVQGPETESLRRSVGVFCLSGMALFSMRTVKLTQTMMADRLMFVDHPEATVLELVENLPEKSQACKLNSGMPSAKRVEAVCCLLLQLSLHKLHAFAAPSKPNKDAAVALLACNLYAADQ
eukprot:1158904-Pelagomonas_calceolata.AAC.4